MIEMSVDYDIAELKKLAADKTEEAIAKAIQRARSTSVRDMKAEAKKQVRKRKAIKAGAVSKSLRVMRPTGNTLRTLSWGVMVKGGVTSFGSYKPKQTSTGVSVEINKGKITKIAHAFVATMKEGHVGVFLRRGKSRLKIKERFASRPIDALSHRAEIEAVLARGIKAFAKTIKSNLDDELGK